MSKRGDNLSSLTAQPRMVVLTGKEPFLLAQGARDLAKALEEAFGPTDQWTFDGETAELSDVLDELRSYALIQHHKLVILDRADVFLAGGRRESEDSRKAGTRRRRALEAYAAGPAPEATLLMRSETWRPCKLDKLVPVIKCEPLKPAEAVRWCTDKCEPRHGRAIDRAAATLLVELVGPDLSRLDSELAKLSAFVAAEAAIGVKDVKVLVGVGRQERAWALQSAIVAGKPGNACVKLHELLEVSQLDKTLVTWAISDLLRRLHTAAQLLRQGELVHAWTVKLRLFGAEGDRMVEIARRCEPGRLARLLAMTVETDQRNKSSGGDPVRNLEALTLLVTDTIGCL